MNSSVSALTTLSPNVQAVALPSATARTALERLPSPLELKARQPLPLELASQVAASRDAIRAILDGDDPRLLVVVGPCSIHDPAPPSNTPNASRRWATNSTASCSW